MMQVTRAAFQAKVSLNKQATDPMSHTPVESFLQEIQRCRYLQIPMVDLEQFRLRFGRVKDKIGKKAK